MIDYTKIQILGVDIKKLLQHHNLEFIRSVSEKTGLLDTKTICHYHKCKIIVYDSGTVRFSGSIHKFYNSITGIEAPNKDPKGYNGNQFYYYEIDFVRQHLVYLFNVPSEQMQIQNIEYGLNLTTSFNPQGFITGLLLFGVNPFEFRFNEFYAQSVHDQYIIKIYNKGNQYDMPLNTLRFEIKVLKMIKQSKDVGIAFMSDITVDRLKKAKEYLITQLETTLYYDNTIIKKNLSKKQQNKLKDYNNHRFWQKLTRQQRSKDKKKLNTIIEKKSQNQKEELRQLIKESRLQFNRLSETPKRLQFNYSSIVSNRNPLTLGKCPVTGVDISMQKKGSNLLSNTGLKHLEEKNIIKFNELKSILLTGNHNEYELTVYDQMSKQIRNRYYNNTQQFRPEQYKLFAPYHPKGVVNPTP
jgi:hypothetical protein